MANLVTVGQAKVFLGLDDSCDDARLKQVIAYVSAGIEAYCGRTFALSEYKVWRDGNGTRVMRLDQWPITRLYQVACGSQDLGRVSYTGAAAESFASSDGVTLSLIDSSVHDLTLASYATATALKVAVDALDGWVMTIFSGADGLNPAKLRPFSTYTLGAGNEVDLEVPDEAIEAVVSNGSQWLIEGGFPYGVLNVFVWYKAGYATIPADLTYATLQILSAAWNASDPNRDLTKSEEKLGDYAYKNGSGTAGSGGSGIDITSLVASYDAALAPYKRVEFAG